jgi:hypothetical protein
MTTLIHGAHQEEMGSGLVLALETMSCLGQILNFANSYSQEHQLMIHLFAMIDGHQEIIFLNKTNKTTL